LEAFLLVDDFVDLVFVFVLVECLMLLCFDDFAVGAARVDGVVGATAGVLLSGVGAVAVPAAWASASASVGRVLAARKAKIANAQTSVFIWDSWIEITNRCLSRTREEVRKNFHVASAATANDNLILSRMRRSR
jgi:hypothetical protein